MPDTEENKMVPIDTSGHLKMKRKINLKIKKKIKNRKTN